MKTKTKKFIMEMGRVCLLFFIPYTTGAFLYGELDWDNIFHSPTLIVSVIIFFILLKKHIIIENKNGE